MARRTITRLGIGVPSCILSLIHFIRALTSIGQLKSLTSPKRSGEKTSGLMVFPSSARSTKFGS
jgi:hypothetical protein